MSLGGRCSLHGGRRSSSPGPAWSAELSQQYTHTQGQLVEKCCWHLIRRIAFDSPGSSSSETEHCFDLLYITGACILCLELETEPTAYVVDAETGDWKCNYCVKKHNDTRWIPADGSDYCGRCGQPGPRWTVDGIYTRHRHEAHRRIDA